MDSLVHEHMKEIEQALQTEQPSRYLNPMLDTDWFHKPPFDVLYRLSKTEQSPVHHPEGDAWKHTMLVVNEAAKVKEKSSNPTAFMWAALLHDVGKPDTTRNRKGKITAYNHDTVGAPIAEEFLMEYLEDTKLINFITAMVKYHMEILYMTRNLPFGNREQMIKEVNPKDIALLGWCDRMGRVKPDKLKIKQEVNEFYKHLIHMK